MPTQAPFEGLVVAPPKRIPLLLRPFVWLSERILGREAVPGRLLTHFPKGAVGAGVFEATAAGPSDLDGTDGRRILTVTRIVASAVTGCRFCIDMNASSWAQAGLTPEELYALLDGTPEALGRFDPRVATAGRYAVALSLTPIVLDTGLVDALRRLFSPREIVVLATTIAQVNYWSRFSQGLGVPPAGFFDAASCPRPKPLP